MSTLETVNPNKCRRSSHTHSHLLTCYFVSFTRICIKRILALFYGGVCICISHFNKLNRCATLMKRVWSVKNVCKFQNEMLGAIFQMWNFKNVRFVRLSVSDLCVWVSFWHVASLSLNNAHAICWLLHIVWCFFFVFAFIFVIAYSLFTPSPIKVKCIATQFWIPNIIQ